MLMPDIKIKKVVLTAESDVSSPKEGISLFTN